VGRSYPRHYDLRWISLHGLNAINTGIGVSNKPGPLTLSPDRWTAIGEQNRQQYRSDMYLVADKNFAQSK
jgi:hypothetical protein